MGERGRTMAGAAGVAAAAMLAALAAVWPAVEVERPAPADGAAPPGVAVTGLELGRAVRLDKRIASPADTFSPGDAIYASVVTEGEAEHVRLTARWSREGQVVAEVSQGIAPSGTVVSEFNVWKPRGFVPGAYEVEILVDGVPAGRREFSVR